MVSNSTRLKSIKKIHENGKFQERKSMIQLLLLMAIESKVSNCCETTQLLFDELDEVKENIFRPRAFAVWTLRIQPGV